MREKVEIRKWNAYLADMNPGRGTEPGKIRPVVVVQTDLLNGVHPSTVVCPITTVVEPRSMLLRVHLRVNEAGLRQASDILVDQVRAIDNRRLLRHLGPLNRRSCERLQEGLMVLLS